MISLSKLRGKTTSNPMIEPTLCLSSPGTIASTRLLAASLRNLSISSSSQQQTSNSSSAGRICHQDVAFSPLTLRQNTKIINDIGINCPLWRKKEIFELPLTNKVIESPTKINKVVEDVIDENKTAILPDNTKSEDDTGKQAKNHMILIRRIKMNKHKLRKLRKKMKYEWAKVSWTIA